MDMIRICKGLWPECLKKLFVWKLLGVVLAGFASSASAATYGQSAVAAVLLAEARGEGQDGMLAVAEVIRRRADAVGVSMLAILKPGIFSSLNRTSLHKLIRKFQSHPLYPQALRIAALAYNEPIQLGNRTRGATHFTHKSEKPYWAEGHMPVAIIGRHAFYRLEPF